MATSDTNPVSAHKIIRVTDYGAIPDSYQDAVLGERKAIDAAKTIDGPVILEFPRGRYDFFPEHAEKIQYYISNTTTEDENPDVTKTIGMLFKGIHHLRMKAMVRF